MLFTLAETALDGIGDRTLGEWREVGEVAVHLRRRLTPLEIAGSDIGAVVDVRGQPEAARRIAALQPFLSVPLRGRPVADYA